VATARYELYWMWSIQYQKESWLMLIDARDVWFQLHPFKELETRGKVSGELYLFGVSLPSMPCVATLILSQLSINLTLPHFDRKMPMLSE